MLISLTAYAGFDLALDGQTLALLDGNGRPMRPTSIRTLAAMRPVLYDPDAAGPAQLYFMYRNFGPLAPQAATRRLGLRFDVTVIRPGMIGREPIKTFGHYHPPSACGTPFPELYQVLWGEAWILLQSTAELRIVRAGRGDTVLIPPGFGHVSINVGTSPLVLANWVADGFDSDYRIFKERKGAAAYVLQQGNSLRLRRNRRYERLNYVVDVPLRLESLIGRNDHGSIFGAVCSQPDAFTFLLEPSRRRDLWFAETDQIVRYS